VTLIWFAAAAALGNVVGAWAVVRHLSRSLHAIEAGIAFGAGFMLAVAVIEVFPVALKEGVGAAWFVLGGYLAVHVAQHVLIPHFHYGEFLASGRLGLLLFLAVLVHKLPEGVTMASMMLASGQSKARAVGSAVGLGLATVLGAALTEVVTPLTRHGLALSAGVTLYVAASNLVPEFQNRRRWSSALAFFGGVAAFFASDWLIERWLA
jgi:zinc transporter ZupT